MKTLITTLNSKFIHKSLSLRLLYVACKERHDIDFKEYTIKDDLNHIVDDFEHFFRCKLMHTRACPLGN